MSPGKLLNTHPEIMDNGQYYFPERVRDSVAKKPRRICQKIRESDAFKHSTRSLVKVTARCRDLPSTLC